MQIDPRLSEIDDSLYRVSVRALIVQDDKVLLVNEIDTDNWWAIPGGGVDYGETVEMSLKREIEEELGVPHALVSSDLQIAFYSIGNVANGIPRMNLYFRVTIPKDQIKKTSHIKSWNWFTKDEFMKLNLSKSYIKAGLAEIIFNNLK